jgi:hypothetical protein
VHFVHLLSPDSPVIVLSLEGAYRFLTARDTRHKRVYVICNKKKGKKRHMPRHIEGAQVYPGGPNGPAAVRSKTPGAGSRAVVIWLGHQIPCFSLHRAIQKKRKTPFERAPRETTKSGVFFFGSPP